MTDPELQEFAELWRETEVPKEEDFAKLIRKAKRQAVLMGWADILLGVFILGSLLLGVIAAPSPASIAGTLLLASSVMWINWKRRKMRQIIRTLSTEDRASFFESSLKVARADLARATLGAYLFPPLILLAILVQVGIRHGGVQHPLLAIAHWAVSVRGLITLPLLVALFLYQLRRRRHDLERVRSFEEIRDRSAQEARRDEEETR